MLDMQLCATPFPPSRGQKASVLSGMGKAGLAEISALVVNQLLLDFTLNLLPRSGIFVPHICG